MFESDLWRIEKCAVSLINATTGALEDGFIIGYRILKMARIANQCFTVAFTPIPTENVCKENAHMDKPS